ncbi:MAG: HEAT repeat domain-containing protein [Acidobacteria bacterium]|nr:HEAT repeat domain-containing protein [Acidobacteriota bacterium]
MAVGIKSIINKSNVFLFCSCLVLATTLSFSSNALAQSKATKKNNKAEPIKTVKEAVKETKEIPIQENKPAEIDPISQFESDVAEQRVTALNKLLTDNNPQIADFITRALKDIDWLVRANALQAIARLDVKQRSKLLPKIIEASKDSYWFVRGSATIAITELARQKHPSEQAFIQQTFNLLIELQLDSHPFVRKQSIPAILAVNPKEAIKFIAPLLTDENSDVEWLSAITLVKINDKQAVSYLHNAQQLKRTSSHIYASALYHFGEKDFLPILLSNLDKVDIALKRELIHILCQANDLQTVEVLTKTLKTSLAEDPRDEKIIFEIIPTLSKLPSPTSLEILKTLLVDPDRKVQLSAIQALSDTKNPKVVAVLIEQLLLARDREFGDSLVKAISTFQQVETVDALFKVRKDENGKNRPAIDFALSKMGITIDNLSLAIRSGKTPNWQTPRAAARWLAALGVPSSLEPLVAALNHPDVQVRTEAAQALGMFGDRAAIEPLIALLADPNPIVKEATVEALKTLGINSEAITARLNSTDWRVRADAANLAGRMGIKDVVPLLVANVESGEISARLESINALAKLKDSQATKALIAVLEDENAAIRATAAVALGNLGDEQAAEPLVKMLTSYDVALGALAADSLIKLSSNNATPALIKTLSSRNWRARAQAARILGHLRPLSAITALIPILSDSTAPARYYAGQALSKMGESAINPLIAALKTDRRGTNRYGVARALATIGNNSVDALCQLLTDTDESLRILAANVLAEIGDKRAIESLVNALGDDRFIVRSSVAVAIGRMGEEALNPVLDSLQSKNSPQRRAAAALALKNLGLRQAAPALVLALSDKEDTVRANAADALATIGDTSVLAALTAIAKNDRADTVRAAAQRAINEIQR